MSGPHGDEFSFERRFLERGRWFLITLLKPAVFLLAALGVSPNAVSVAQIGVGAAIVFTVSAYPRLTFLLFLLALLLDALDGALARHIGRASPFGALLEGNVGQIANLSYVYPSRIYTIHRPGSRWSPS